MPYPFYPNPLGPAKKPVALPPPWDAPRQGEDLARDLQCYLPDQGLRDAVNAALLLGRPLLLTGEAGTGKTKLAYHLAWQLGLSEPLKFETKSTSSATDLFYLYDALRHFRAVQTPAKSPDQERNEISAREYITLNPLGLAILLSLPRSELEKRRLLPLLEKAGVPHAEPRRCVVLIDEIDKAPRDFPNDLLNELENFYFRIPELAGELGNEPIAADPAMRPVTVITSNSEKHLPEPFLRRCVYYNIPFPQKKEMRDILRGYAQDFTQAESFFNDALELFYTFRDSNPRKQPSTAELLTWLHLLREAFREKLADPHFRRQPHPLAAHPDTLKKTFSVLLKVEEDQDRIPELLDNWKQETKT
ncbi:MAG: AAA domain-containing protein [Gammaproteobacteria bacterium]|nr:AAA domain-containing protein [Gammaproteobacteria bacterium]